jgi:5'-deoxynucleotidase YfbR-like HD superfamily hydrolase
MYDQVNFVYAAGETRRFHTWPVLREQNVAAHSWHVMMLGYVLYGQDLPGCTFQFIMALATHDMAECRMGDLPSPAKRTMDSLLTLEDKGTSFREQWGVAEQSVLHRYNMDWEQQLTDEEKRRMKVVDAMEGAIYCVRERAMGNTLITEPWRNFSKYLSEVLVDISDEVPLEERQSTVHEREWDLFTFIKAQWEQADGKR